MNAAQVGTSVVIGGGATALGIGAYNLGNADQARFAAEIEDAHLASSVGDPNGPADAAVIGSIDRYVEERQGRAKAWMGAGAALGATGLAAVGLGVASLLTKGAAASTALRNGAIAAGAAATIGGAVTWRQYKDWASSEPSERLLDEVGTIRAAEAAGSFGPTLPAAAVAPVAIAMSPGRQVAAHEEAASLRRDIRVGDYARNLDQLLEMSGGARDVVKDSYAYAAGTDRDASTRRIANALDIDRDGTLTGGERTELLTPFALGGYAALRQAVGSSDELAGMMATIDEHATANEPPEIRRLLLVQHGLADAFGIDPGPDGRTDWRAVTTAADRYFQP